MGWSWRSGRWWASAAAVVVATTAASAGPAAAAGGFAPTAILRTAPELYLGDIAAAGSGVGVIWEEPRAIGPALFLRMSRNGGATFTGKRRLDVRPNRRPSVAVCGGRLWVASEVHYGEDQPGDWDITLEDHDLDGTGSGEQIVTDPEVLLAAREPAVACVGGRFIAVAWLQRLEGDGWRAWLRVLDPTPLLAGTGPAGVAAVDMDLGPAKPSTPIALDATNRRVVVAWRQANKLRFRRIAVAPGTGVSLSPSPSQIVATGPRWGTEVAIDKARVVIAYTRANDLFTRNSSNGGASFGAAVKRLDGDPSCCWIAYPNSLDIVGARVLLEGTRGYGDLDPATQEWRLLSSNGGATFSKQKVGGKGERAGAWAGPRSAPQIVEAWDDWTRWQGDNHIRFHRQS